jgi:DNA-binding CsgD family transcriptional regulator
LALLELPAALTKAQLVGQEPLPDAIPLTSRLQALFGRRIDQLQFETQAALLIAAADNTGELAAVAGAAAELELSADALDPAETSGLIRATGGVIKFRHPLVRSALYERASLSQRQRVHSALASALSGDQHADRRVWHQAMAAVGGDEEVAAALEASARRAQLRAGHASAASAYVRAAELTVDESRLVPRLTAAAEAAWDAGQADRARALIVRALPIAEGMLRARLLHLRGVIESRGGNMRDAVSTLIEGADASSNPSLTLEMLLETADAAVEMGDRARVAELGARASKLPTRTARDQFSREVLIGFAELFAGEYERARARFDDALRLAGELDDALVQVWAAWAASLGLGLGAGLPFATRAVELARRQGLLSMLPIALDQQAAELFRNSNFDLAYAAAEEGYRLSLDLGQGLGWHLMTMARVEAIWGREAEAREHAEQVLSLAQRGGDTGLATTARATLGLVELTIGRPEAAANSLLELAAELPDTVPIIVPTVIPDTVEAVVRAGLASELVDEPLAAFRAWVLQAPSDARRAQLALCEALAGHRPAEEAFTEAIALSGALPPFQRARGELIYGEWLRRERRRADARVHLRAAIELFRTVGATPWERRAEAELRATGETARKRDPSTLDQLTPQELQVARLAAEGMTNPQIGAQLFLSPRTVEYHLRKVFSKLGIASRNELIRHGVPRRDTP